MTFSDKLIFLRKQSSLSQEDLAEKLGVSRQSVSRWEMGSAMPDASNLLQISKIFGVTTDYLLNEEYSSDNDIPGIKRAADNTKTLILSYFLILEVMNLLLQFMCVVILDNIFFSILSFIPFIAMICGFEYAYRKKGGQNNITVTKFRKKFYIISSWLGLYFPIRILISVTSAITGFFDPRYTPQIIVECIILVIYICFSAITTLNIEKHYIQK